MVTFSHHLVSQLAALQVDSVETPGSHVEHYPVQIYDEHGALIPLSTDGEHAGVYLHQGAAGAEGGLGGYTMQPYLAQGQQDYLHARHGAEFPVSAFWQVL